MASRNKPRLATACLIVAVSVLLSACGGSSTSEPRVPVASAGHGARPQAAPASQPILFENSFLVTHEPTLNQLAPAFTMTSLLHAVSRHLNSIADLDHHHEPDDFALKPFQVAGQDVTDHNNLTDLDAKVGSVPKIYNSWNAVILPKFNPALGTEPFRLIAVVNRLDLAGDFDRRDGGVEAGAQRKWFGEARLIFAVDNGVQGPLPMTISMEYRLPGLKKDASGNTVLDPNFDFKADLSNDDWVKGRKLWAKAWQDLSGYTLGSPDYVTKLRNILSWITYGIPYDVNNIQTTEAAANHLAMRSGENVRKVNGVSTTEFEYREFYLNGLWMLSTRKLRNEPFACARNSKALVDRIAADWSNTTSSMLWRTTLGYRNMSLAEIASTTDSCHGTLPYGQVDEDGQDQDHDHVVDTQLRAKFARFIPADWVWTAVPPLPDPPLEEQKTHSFALGSCSGCHGRETGTSGFQVAPAASGAGGAGVSNFLKGETNAFPRGPQQNYNEPKRRMDLAARFAIGDTTITVVEDPLLSDLACNQEDETCAAP